MELYSTPPLNPGEFVVNMNPGSGEPFGLIRLAPHVRLHIDSDEDADRLIRAAVRLKAMRAALGNPHVFAPGSGYQCETCGMLEGWKDHLAPVLEDEADAATVLAEAIKHGTPVIVTDDEAALEGTVAAPPQDAPYAEVLRP